MDRHNLLSSNSTASLANMTSGTTFAAKARAAELNAVRARKAAKDMAIEDDVPTVTPISLGALRFTRPRAKARGVKDVNSSDRPGIEDGDLQPEFCQMQSGRIGMNQTLTEASQYGGGGQRTLDGIGSTVTRLHRASSVQSGSSVPFRPTFPVMELSPESNRLAQMVANYDLSEWDPDLPKNGPNPSPSRSQMSNSAPASRQPSRASSRLTRPSLMESSAVLGKDSETTVRFRQKPAPKIAEFENTASLDQQKQEFVEGKGLTEQSVYSSAHPIQTKDILSSTPATRKASGTFVMPPPFIPKNTTGQSPCHPAQTGYGPGGLGQSYYPAVKGTLNYDFHFPPEAQNGPYVSHYLSKSFQSRQQDSFTVAPVYPEVSNIHPYQNNSTSYRSLSGDSKKDMLLQNLNEVVESSMAQSSISSSTRTVLRDPLARPHPSNGRIAPSESPVNTTSLEAELIHSSEPLPWKDRPVDIHDASTPGLTNAELAALSTYPHFQLTLNPNRPLMVYGDRHSTDLADQSLQEAEQWFHTDNRGQKDLRDHLEGVANKYEMTRKAYTKEAAAKALQYRQDHPGSWSETSDITTVPEKPNVSETTNGLLIPVLANLHAYLCGPQKQSSNYFARYARPPEWCIDQDASAKDSFFGGDWGAPPPRVGRDPRYRPILHEGRYTVFEDLGGRAAREPFGKRFR